MASDSDYGHVADDFQAHAEERTDERSRMSFLEHLDELRQRILYSLYALVACCVVDVLLLGAAATTITSGTFGVYGGKLIFTQADGRLHVQPEALGAGRR